MFQINTDFLINQLTTYFYTRHLTPLIHLKKTVVLSITESVENIHLLTHLYYFSKWVRCSIFQINTDLLVIYQNINTFTQETL